jgi:hypothetical protein
MKKFILFSIILLFSVPYINAATYYLKTSGVSSAQTPSNWNTGGTGGGGSNASNFITSGDIFIISSSQTAAFGGDATFGSGVTLQCDGTINISGPNADVTVNGVITFSSISTTQVTMAGSGSSGNSFVLSSGATLKTVNTNGIQGSNCSLPVNSIKKTVTLNAGANFELNGSSSQATLGLPTTVNSLNINNSAGVILSGSTIVTTTLTLSSGLLKTSNGTLTVNSDISVTSPDFTKMIVLDDGTNFGSLKLKTASNKSYTFPVGDIRGTVEYSPITINLTSGANASAYLAVNLKNQKDANNTSTTNYLNRSWTVTPTGLSSFAYDITINYLNADVVGTESLLYFAKYDAGVWLLLGQPNTTTNTFTNNGLTSFSTFTGGEAGSLPVHLQSLYSTVSGRNVNISWVTISENNNTGFEVMRASVDKNGAEGNYTTQGFVKGNGTTTQQKTYSFSDNNLNTGKYKYKLKQIDNNGNFEYFDLNGFVEIGMPNKYSVSQNYPNPFNPTTKIDFELPADSKVTMIIYDISGREVTKVLNNEFRNVGYHTADFNASNFSSGIYFYRLTADNFSVTKKMMLIK